MLQLHYLASAGAVEVRHELRLVKLLVVVGLGQFVFCVFLVAKFAVVRVEPQNLLDQKSAFVHYAVVQNVLVGDVDGEQVLVRQNVVVNGLHDLMPGVLLI